MKDEIKEILEDVKRHLDYVEATKQASIRDNEMKAMYDYITNLEQEKQEMKNGWQQEVYNKDEILNRWYETQGRIDKAIDKLYCWGETLNPEFQKVMLNILQGSDKE
jgi:CRISPR/Cas system CSM-associated protein Csm2 small subunit